MPQTSCKKCGRRLPVHKGRHRPRQFCTVCRPPRMRREKAAARAAELLAEAASQPAQAAASSTSRAKPATAPTVVRQMPATAPAIGRLVAATTAKLEAAGKATEPEGILVLALAQSIDEGGHSGASLASLSREFGRALDVALRDADGEDADVVDGIEWGVG